MIDYANIKKEIRLDCIRVFGQENYGYTEAQIDKAINAFFKIVAMRTNYPILNGFAQEVIGYLEQACITKVGELAPVKALSSCMDSFLKRLIAFTQNTYTTDTFKSLVGRLGVFPSMSGSNTHGGNWKGNGDGRYVLYRAEKARNEQIHNTPEITKAEIAERLMYILSAFILIILKYEAQLLSVFPDLYDPTPEEYQATDEDLQAYDFLNYSKTTRDLKNQVIECYILRSLHKDGPQTASELSAHVEGLIGKRADVTITARIKRIEKNGHILLDTATGKYSLTEDQRSRLDESEANCNANKTLFNQSLSELLSGTSLEGKIIEVCDCLGLFLQDRWLLISDADRQEEFENPDSNTFLDYLKGYFPDEESAKEIFRKIVELCRTNDIMFRISTGKAISSMADAISGILSDQRVKRNVYLDTQVVLPMLCTVLDDVPVEDNLDSMVADHLLKLSRDDEKVNIKLCRVYLKEICQHVIQAVRLLHFETLPGFGAGLLSRNVFYHHYIWLKTNSKLPEDITTFAEYLYAYFRVPLTIEPDKIDEYAERGLRRVIRNLLENKLRIEIEDIDYYDDKRLKDSYEIFSEVISRSRTTKGPGVLKHDAIMGEFLFESKDQPKPAFLTRDHTFFEYRKRYAESCRPDETYFWLLFSPLKFINSHDLLEIHVNPVMLTEDLLLLIEDEESRKNAKCFGDVNLRLTDIDGLSESEKRKRFAANFKLFSGREFADITADDINTLNTNAVDLNRAWDRILDRYSGEKFEDQKSLHELLKEESIFNALMEAIQSCISTSAKDLTGVFRYLDSLKAEPEATSSSEGGSFPLGQELA